MYRLVARSLGGIPISGVFPKKYPTHGEGTDHSEGTKRRKKTNRGGKTMEDLVARRRSFKWGGQYWNRQTTQGEKQKQNPISRQRGRNGRVREFAYPERARRNMKHIKGRHRHGLCHIAEYEICHLGQYGDMNKAEGEHSDGVLVRPRHRTTGAAVCVSRAHLHGLR